MLKAMIMAAGIGSRLMPLTTNIPKPMVPVANKPIMEYAIHLLKRHKVTDVIANLHYLPNTIKDYFEDGSRLDINMQYSEEQCLLGTAGGVKNNEWFLNDTFVVLSGDGLTDIDITKMLDFHKRKGALATIALKEVSEVEEYGVVVLDEHNQVKSFQEKPKQEEALSNLVNTGIYILEPEIFKYIPSGQVYDFGKELFPFMAQNKMPIFGHIMEGYWCDVGNLDVYRQAHYDLLDRHIDLSLYGLQRDANIWSGNKVTIHPTVKILGKAIIGEGTTIGANSIIRGNVVIGTNCTIGENTIIDRAVLWDGVKVDSESILNECVVGKNSILGKQAIVGSGCILSDCCTVETNAQVINNVKIETGKVIPKFSIAG